MAHNFEERDLNLLEQSMRLRERMMNNIASKPDQELPTKPSELMAVTNLLESVDRSIFAKAKIDIEETSAKNEEATKEVLRQLMSELHNTKGRYQHSNQTSNASIPSYESRSQLNINEGELIPRSDNHNPEDI